MRALRMTGLILTIAAIGCGIEPLGPDYSCDRPEGSSTRPFCAAVDLTLASSESLPDRMRWELTVRAKDPEATPWAIDGLLKEAVYEADRTTLALVAAPQERHWRLDAEIEVVIEVRVYAEVGMSESGYTKTLLGTARREVDLMFSESPRRLPLTLDLETAPPAR